jgi:hypothetical protein
VGECANLSARFNTGYGNISPKNCFKGVQETNCRLNNLLYSAIVVGQRISLWIGSEYQDLGLLWWCRGPESNWLRPPFQGGALPLSYPGTAQILETHRVRVKLSIKFNYLVQVLFLCMVIELAHPVAIL